MEIVRQKKKKFPLFFKLLVVVGLVIGGFYVASLDMFEHNGPEIKIEDSILWNLKTPILLSISDDVSGIKRVDVYLQTKDNKQVLFSKKYSDKTNQEDINITYEPQGSILSHNSKLKLIVEVTDNSKWNFLSGNTSTKLVDVKLDIVPPDSDVVLASPYIKKGGGAIVVFKVDEDNIDEMYVEVNSKYKFNALDFNKEDYYIATFAWPLKEDSFRAYVVVKDKAGNIEKRRVKIPPIDKKYRTSNIRVSDRFINGKIAELADKIYDDAGSLSKEEKLDFVNAKERQKNEDLIHSLTQNVTSVKSLPTKVFYPLKNAKYEAGFGDHRYYMYQGKRVSESYHLGVDLASTKNADILTSNSGKVVFAGFNGIYGNSIIIDHGFGVYSLYGHCSMLMVEAGDEVIAGDLIAKTGKTGLALGDHLHFGLLIQGIEIRPNEWMSSEWVKRHLLNVIKNAKKLIVED